MLNKNYKEQAIKDLQKVNEEYIKVYKTAIGNMERLQQNRIMAIKTIQYVERYIINLANKPRNFETKIGEIKIRYTKFQREMQEIEFQQAKMGTTNGFGVAGALGGAGLAAFGPTAAMSVAMAFGTASTGTAIASLSGAAAKKRQEKQREKQKEKQREKQREKQKEKQRERQLELQQAYSMSYISEI